MKTETKTFINFEELKRKLLTIPQQHFTLEGVIATIERCSFLEINTEEVTTGHQPKIATESAPPNVGSYWQKPKVQTADLRPCYVGDKKALFYRWVETDIAVFPATNNEFDKLTEIENREKITSVFAEVGGFISKNIHYEKMHKIIALVEYESGKVAEVEPSRIRFIDTAAIMEQYDFSTADFLNKKFNFTVKTAESESRAEMKPQEAIQILESFVISSPIPTRYNRAVATAKKALEKQIKNKPALEGDGYDDAGNLIYDTGYCPNCNESYEVDYHTPKYCESCGQALDWSTESEGDDK